MSTFYTETDLLDWGDLVAVPHFAIDVETGREIYGNETTVTAALSHVMLGHLCPRGRVDGIELTTAQAERVWGATAVEAWEEAAAERFDAQSALSDEANDAADYRREIKRDDAA
jgi:hypothetical protein